MFAVFVTSTLWEPFAFKINKNIFIWNKRICALLLMNVHVFCKFHRCGMASEIRLFFLLCDQLCPPCLTSRPSLVNSFWKPNWLIPIHGNCSNCILAGLARQNGGRKTVLAVASFSIAHYQLGLFIHKNTHFELFWLHFSYFWLEPNEIHSKYCIKA